MRLPLYLSCPLGMVAAHKGLRPRQHLKISQGLQARLTPAHSIGTVKGAFQAERHAAIQSDLAAAHRGVPPGQLLNISQISKLGLHLRAATKQSEACLSYSMHSHSTSFASLE